jgi:hypothetical protein
MTCPAHARNKISRRVLNKNGNNPKVQIPNGVASEEAFPMETHGESIL